MASPLAVMTAFQFAILMDVEIAQAEEDDRGAVLKPDFDERIFARFAGDDRVDAASVADVTPMHVRVVRRLGRAASNGYIAADENAARRLSTGGSRFVGIHSAEFGS